MTATNVNTAGQDALDEVEGLQGHGYEIVRTRDERGGFKSLRELEEVPGLTGKVTDEIRARLTL